MGASSQGCDSEPTKPNPCPSGTCGGPNAPDGGDDLDSGQPPPPPDPPDPDAGVIEPLDVKLQLNGSNIPCGACAVLVAQVKGGLEPYVYTWSDPELQGPGPHTVCPEMTTSYSVEVTDGSEVTEGEFPMPAMKQSDTVEVACIPVEDGGPEIWGGCFLAQADAGAAPPAEVCKTIDVVDPLFGTDLGEAPVSFSAEVASGLQETFEPGKTYELAYDQLLVQFGLGEAVTVQIYGGNEPCSQEQLFGTWTLDGTPHQSYCFVPEQAWKYIRIDIDIGDVLLYLDLLPPVATTCRGCSLEMN